MKKIGITFEPPTHSTDIFINGIKQNALFLNELLLNIGFESFLIVPKSDVEKLKDLYGFDSRRCKWIVYEDLMSTNIDVLIQFTFQVDLEVLLSCKKRGCKLIAYKCGNDFTLDLEATLHSQKDRVPQYYLLRDHLPIFDQVWSIPQMVNTNLHYWKTLYRCESKEVPFIWSPVAMERYEIDCINSKFGELMYQGGIGQKKIAIFEPNIGVIKWFFPALLVCENAYRLSPESINFVYVTNTKMESLNLDLVNDLVKSLELNRDKKISVEGRYNSLYFMKAHADICVSHQWENPLNYLYLDLAWWGWPIVHNAHLCKDIGYYYDGFNYEQGGEVLMDVIKNHDKNLDDYISRNRKLIDRYLPTNTKLQESYKKLIEDLFR